MFNKMNERMNPRSFVYGMCGFGMQYSKVNRDELIFGEKMRGIRTNLQTLTVTEGQGWSTYKETFKLSELEQVQLIAQKIADDFEMQGVKQVNAEGLQDSEKALSAMEEHANVDSATLVSLYNSDFVRYMPTNKNNRLWQKESKDKLFKLEVGKREVILSVIAVRSGK